MPRIPTYESQLRAAQGTAPYTVNERGFLPFTTGMTQLGQAMKNRGEALLEEHDSAMALSSYNRLRDATRSKMMELLQREGRAAYGVQQEYNEWMKDAMDKTAVEDLTVQRQRELFMNMANKSRATDLNELAAHEAKQHGIVKKETSAGLAAVIVRDAGSAPMNFARHDTMIDDYFTSLDTMYPGHDLTIEKATFLEGFRENIAKQLIVTDVDAAEKYIDKYKADLGDAYYTLKNALKTQASDNRVTAAYAFLVNKHGEDYRSAQADALDPGEWAALNIKNLDEAQELGNQFSSMLSDKIAAENQVKKAHEEAQVKLEGDYMRSIHDPEFSATLPNIHAAHAAGRISNTFYKWWNTGRTEDIEDNWEIRDRIEKKAQRGLDVTEDLKAAAIAGQLKPSTLSTIAKYSRDTSHNRAREQLDIALTPTEYDKYFDDKSLKKQEAIEEFYALAVGRKWSEAKDIVLQNYTDKMIREWSNLGRPKYMKEDLFRNLPVRRDAGNFEPMMELLRLVEAETDRARDTGLLTDQEYVIEMKKIKRHRAYLNRQQMIVSTQGSKPDADYEKDMP